MAKYISLNSALSGPWTLKKLQPEGVWIPGLAHCIGLWEGPPGSILHSDCQQIAGVLFNEFNGASIQMHVAAEPGAKWLNRAYLGICFGYAFRQCKVNKVLGYVGSQNLVAQRFDKHLGFKEETRIPDAHPDGELIIYSMTRDECRWLELSVPPEVILYG